MDADPQKANPIALAREIIQFRKEHHPFGANYKVSVRLGHADIQDSTAVADILSAVEELGYDIVKRD
ncbi:MAG: hypothetical protein EXR58_08090 [Chloroflexi bacterium]|nr:hypothetical protein [Chloroflexota bacterium]